MKKYICFIISFFVFWVSLSHAFFNKGNWGITEKGLNIFFTEIEEKKGSPNILVGIIDTGVDFSHPDLSSTKWENPGESGPWVPKNEKERIAAPNCFDKSCNKIDDDNNGYIDDVSGFDFPTNSNLNEDFHGHGSHIAGIIAGKRDKAKRIGGIAPNIKIASYRYYALNGEHKLSEKTKTNLKSSNHISMTVESIKLAIKHKVNIINYSGGGNEFSREEKEALVEAKKNNILVVVAAGNDGVKLGMEKYYPCSYQLENIICVGNHGESKEIDKSSNKSNKYVDLFAPGHSILASGNNQNYLYFTGTSQSTAFITGVAALILSEDPTLTPSEVKDLILKNANKEKNPNFKNMAKAEGFLDLPSLFKETSDYILLKNFNNDKKYSKSKSHRDISSVENGLSPLNPTYKQELNKE